MKQYSPFFETIYDQENPVGNIGKGSHYSVFRAPIFKTETGLVLDRAMFHTFAIIWDEDHDTRIISVIEELLFRNLLHTFTIVGERKGGITFLSSLTVEFENEKCTEYPCDDELNEGIVHDITHNLFSDEWHVEFGTISNNQSIISDSDNKVVCYLKNIKNLWGLGTVSIDPHKNYFTNYRQL